MSRIFTVVVLALLSVCICESVNLTAITWEHDVNNHKKLEETFKSDKAIVADVIMGTHNKKKDQDISENIPIIETHKKYQDKTEKTPIILQENGDTSDFSLLEFITETIEYHKKNAQNTKIIKFNFFSMEAVHESINILLDKRREIKFPIWLNADILKGPGDSSWSDPINGKDFINQVKKMDNVVLSLSWRTGNKDEEYKKEHTEAMAKVMKETNVNDKEYENMPINFPIRAIYAVKKTSQDVLRQFYDSVKKTNPHVTYTITTTSEGDGVDVKDLTAFIKSYDVQNIYVDVPEKLRKDLNLGDSGASSLVQFGLLNLLTLVVITFSRN